MLVKVLNYVIDTFNKARHNTIPTKYNPNHRFILIVMADFRISELDRILAKHPQVAGASIAIIENNCVYPFCSGFARVSKDEIFTPNHFLQCALLSKTVAAAFSIEYFANKNISLTSSVNDILRQLNSPWLIRSALKAQTDSTTGTANSAINGDDVILSMLLNHTALGMHYVFGIPLSQLTPTPLSLLDGSSTHLGYKELLLERPAGAQFAYSGGGFVVLQYLLELMEKDSIDNITRSFLNRCGLSNFTFTQLCAPSGTKFAYGHLFVAPSSSTAGSAASASAAAAALKASGGANVSANGEVEPLAFPPLAAGALCTPSALATFLANLAKAYNGIDGAGSAGATSGISTSTARSMLGPQARQDKGALDFMGAEVCGMR